MASRFKELMKKYGKVGIVVHCSISAVSISGLYVAIKSNVDVESMLERIGLPNLRSKDSTSSDQLSRSENPEITTETAAKENNRTTELAASSGGALALAILLNKALFPVRVPITLAVTPPVARFLARRNMMNKSIWLVFGFSSYGLFVWAGLKTGKIEELSISCNSYFEYEFYYYVIADEGVTGAVNKTSQNKFV